MDTTSSPQAALRAGLLRQLRDRDDVLAAGGVHRGWKAGFGTAAAMEKLGTTGPLIGYLTESTLLETDSSVDVSTWQKAVLEPEVALELSAAVPAESTVEDAAAAIGAAAAAIELVDLGGASGDAGQILAANIFHRHYLVGEFLPIVDRAALDGLRLDVTAGSGDRIAGGADPREALGDLAEVIHGLAKLLGSGGEELRQGDLIITGSAIPALEVSAGDAVDVRLANSHVAVLLA